MRITNIKINGNDTATIPSAPVLDRGEIIAIVLFFLLVIVIVVYHTNEGNIPWKIWFPCCCDGKKAKIQPSQLPQQQHHHQQQPQQQQQQHDEEGGISAQCISSSSTPHSKRLSRQGSRTSFESYQISDTPCRLNKMMEEQAKEKKMVESTREEEIMKEKDVVKRGGEVVKEIKEIIGEIEERKNVEGDGDLIIKGSRMEGRKEVDGEAMEQKMVEVEGEAKVSQGMLEIAEEQ